MTENLTAALAAVQTRLPTVGKTETAVVPTKTGGSYKYSYADLAAVSKAILPLLGAAGLTWITKPTFNEAGKFVLVYKLKHISGEEEAGEYPLPQSGTPQETGSAITYARRYTLCSVTGVAPEQDDDDAAAASHRAPAAARQDDWEQAEKPPTADQLVLFAALTKAIDDAESGEDIATVGQRVKAATSTGKLTSTQYKALGRQATAKLTELQPSEAA